MSTGVESEDERGGYVLALVRDVEEWTLLEPQIESLFASLDNPNPYFSPDWLRCWRKWFAPQAKVLAVIVRDCDGMLCACWPFIERRGILGAKILWPFVYDEANYFDPLGDFSRSGLADALCRSLRACLGEFHFIWLPLLRESFWSDHLAPFLTDKSDPRIERIPRETSFAELHDFPTFDHYLRDRLGNKSRKMLRYSLRRLERLGT